MRCALGAYCALLLLEVAGAQAVPMNAEDIYGAPQPLDVKISPDGTKVLMTLTQPALDSSIRGQSRLWIVDADSGESKEVGSANELYGNDRPGTDFSVQARAKWSHDGKSILWIDSDGAADQVWTHDIVSRKTTKLTTGELSVVDYEESPQGTHLALVRAARPIRDAAALKRAEAYFFSDHPEGWWNSSWSNPSRVEIVDRRTGGVVTITDSIPFATDMSWHPLGEQLMFVPRFPSWGGMKTPPVVYNLRSRKIVEVISPDSTLRYPTWSPDGTRMAWLEHVLYSGASRTLLPGRNMAGGLFSHVPIVKIAFVVGQSATKPSVLVSQDSQPSAGQPFIWNGAAGGVLMPLLSNAKARVHLIDPESGLARRITPPEYHVKSFDVSRDGKKLAALLTNANTPTELFIIDISNGNVDQLTHFGRSLPFKPAPVQSVTWRSGDDRFDVHGWLVLPTDYKPTRRYPMIVELHGGPAGTIMDDFWRIQTENIMPAIMASHGYIVLLPNPRGDAGYSPAYTKALVGDLMTGDVSMDVLPGVHAMIARGIADATKVAVSGLSAGATRVAWAISRHPKIFKAASLSDGPVNLVSYWGQASPQNEAWLDFYLEGTPYERMREYIHRSPITHAAAIDTPLLMRFAYGSANLWDSPKTIQGKELQAILYARGVPTEIQIEPLAGHDVRTVNARQLWVEANLAWFNHYLLGSEYRRPSPCDSARLSKVQPQKGVCALPVAQPTSANAQIR